jgi:glyoxylase-like metal-dependent hydrolase (beta-lactamase superfamily II)/rhodanese-related sulfurtransferase
MIRRLKVGTLAKSLLGKTPQFAALASFNLLSSPQPNNFGLLKNVFPMSTQAFQHKNTIKSSYEGSGFYVEQLFTGCLAIYSYYIESGNECFLVDPLFDISEYNELIKSRGKQLKGIFISHYHADYLSGQHELQKQHKCKIFMGPKSIATDTVVTMKEKERIKLGSVELECWHTPGHTEESSCLVLINSEGKRDTIFTGDTIFLNEVGRPDLAVKTNLSAADLASMLFDSLQKLKTLNDDLRIYPGHGSGSACGKSIGKGDYCSLGTQKENNYGLKANNKTDFVSLVLQDMPKPPQYFGYNAKINKFEPTFFEEVSKKSLIELTPEQVSEYSKKEKVIVLDIRSTEELKGGVMSESLCIGYDGGFANWVGTLIDPKDEFIVYGGSQEQALETIKRLYRIGYINILGHASFSIKEWESKGFKVTVPEFYNEITEPNATILDVRKPGEWKDNGVVEGSVRLELT